jgi:hypothetical protein
MTRELKNKYFSIKSPPTVMEIIDDEAIMINGEKGTYYNLSPHATLILESILNGYNLEEISSFNNFDSDANQHIDKMIYKLVAEDILEETNQKQNRPELKEFNYKNFEKEVILTIYDDMQDMLILDPIHEADEVVGWPKKK